MFSSVNLTLFAIRISQFSIHVSQMMQPSYFSIRNADISYNYMQPFYSQFNNGLKNKRNCIVSRSIFSHFLQPVFSILNGPDSDINREDVYGERPKIDQNASNLTVFESLFRACQGIDGGVFFIVFSGEVIIEKTNFVNCSASGRGGVIFFYGSSLTISESCFSCCFSKSDGYSIFCANGRKTIKIDKCHFYDSKGGKSTTVFLNGFDVSTTNLNCTNSNVDSSLFDESEKDADNDLIIASSFSISPSHHFAFEMIEINNNSGPSIIYLDQTDQVDSITNVNIVNCQLTNNEQKDYNSIIVLTKGTTVIKNWGFIFDDYNSNTPLILLYTSDQSTLTLQNCFFSLPESSISTDDPQLIIESSVQFAASNIGNIKFVKSEGCWDQSRFKFREPKTHQKIIISIVVILIFVFGFIFMIVEACKDEKKHKELLKLQEYNEQQNEMIQENAKNQIDNDIELRQKSEMSSPSLIRTNYANRNEESYEIKMNETNEDNNEEKEDEETD